MLNFNDALQIIEDEFSHLPKNIIEVNLNDSTGLKLAEAIHADVNLPAFDNSSMDGYAIKLAGNQRTWNVIGEISAGNFKNYNIDINSAVRIMTGGRLPKEADTVIPIEDIIEEQNKCILRDGVDIKLNQNIRFIGEDLKSGDIALTEDSLLNAQNISLAAACGKLKLKVYRKLSIGVLATGDELVDIAEIPGEDKVRATNLYSILAAIREIDMNPVNLGIVKDNKELLRSSILSALESDLDILITTGGVSVGKYDYLKDIFKESGVETIFWKVNIKPGKPLFFGKYRKDNKTKLIFGLPGNPVSSFVNFVLLIKPAIQKYYNQESYNFHMARLESPVKKTDSRRHFTRGILKFDNASNKFTVKESGSQSSGNLAGLSSSNCLIVIPEDIINPDAGEEVTCIMI
ncbi:MAG: molybdopterin molybdotransferase MoeA [Ignavibacteriaceae bacterium]|nr:molybdopterin molybdotransferase MoeA [Ignavibacteriaceae bacterium]